jgi:hypothetical protein
MAVPKITQQNVHLFIPLKVAKVTEMVSKNKNISWEDALIEFYNSKVYDILEKEETKLWYEGPSYLYMGFDMEQRGENLDI